MGRVDCATGRLGPVELFGNHVLYPHPGNSLTQSSHRDGKQDRFWDQSGKAWPAEG